MYRRMLPLLCRSFGLSFYLLFPLCRQSPFSRFHSKSLLFLLTGRVDLSQSPPSCSLLHPLSGVSVGGGREGAGLREEGRETTPRHLPAEYEISVCRNSSRSSRGKTRNRQRKEEGKEGRNEGRMETRKEGMEEGMEEGRREGRNGGRKDEGRNTGMQKGREELSETGCKVIHQRRKK